MTDQHFCVNHITCSICLWTRPFTLSERWHNLSITLIMQRIHFVQYVHTFRLNRGHVSFSQVNLLSCGTLYAVRDFYRLSQDGLFSLAYWCSLNMKGSFKLYLIVFFKLIFHVSIFKWVSETVRCWVWYKILIGDTHRFYRLQKIILNSPPVSYSLNLRCSWFSNV